MVLTQLFDRSLIERREDVGLEFKGRVFTFGEIEAKSNRIAHALRSRGLRKGDRLCAYLINSIEMIELFLACVKLGVIFVPINILYRDREISHILRDADPLALVSETAVPSPVPVWTVAEVIEASEDLSAERPNANLNEATPAGIIYTSGTTGASKGAVLSHKNFASNAATLISAWRFAPTDRLLLSLPLFHVHGLGNGVHCWLASGCRMRLLERFEHHKAAAEFLDFAPTVFFGVPTMYVRLLELDATAAREIGKGMRLFVSGSAPLPAQILEAFRDKFGHTILERYGMSETLMITSNPYDGERRAGTVGLPLPGVSVQLANPNGTEAKEENHNLVGDQTGEIYVKGDSVFSGYWRRSEEFVDGYFRTGDMAVRSPDGYYTLCGRKNDLIISAGFNIYPREIEEFLLEQDEIAEAAVVGRGDAVRGEVPVAYVVLRAPVETKELEERCRAKLASFKIPRAFVVVENLPRNAMGKLQKHLLQ